MRDQNGKFPHVPRIGWTPLGAQAAVQTDVLVLDHEAAGLLEWPRREQRLLGVQRGQLHVRAQLLLVSIRDDREAVHRADVNAGIALDAQRVGEMRLHVTVETALDFVSGLLSCEPQLDLSIETLEPRRQILSLIHISEPTRLLSISYAV